MAVVDSSDWLDLFDFHLTLRTILEYSSGATQQKTDNYNANKRTRGRMSSKPRVELQYDDEDEHADNCEATTAKDENARTPEMAAMMTLNTTATAVVNGVC